MREHHVLGRQATCCRVEPSNSANVSSIMTVLVENGCRFAVKCGDRSRHEDDSHSIAAVTIEKIRMSTATVTENNTQVVVGGGAISHQDLSVLESLNLSFVGGSARSVGVGRKSPFSSSIKVRISSGRFDTILILLRL